MDYKEVNPGSEKLLKVTAKELRGNDVLKEASAQGDILDF